MGTAVRCGHSGCMRESVGRAQRERETRGQQTRTDCKCPRGRLFHSASLDHHRLVFAVCTCFRFSPHARVRHHRKSTERRYIRSQTRSPRPHTAAPRRRRASNASRTALVLHVSPSAYPPPLVCISTPSRHRSRRRRATDITWTKTRVRTAYMQPPRVDSALQGLYRVGPPSGAHERLHETPGAPRSSCAR